MEFFLSLIILLPWACVHPRKNLNKNKLLKGAKGYADCVQITFLKEILTVNWSSKRKSRTGWRHKGR